MSTRLTICLSFAVVLLSIWTGRTSAQSNNSRLSATEEYVLTQLERGLTADLTNRPEKKRVIRASFLENLLINSNNRFKIHRNGIQIKGAVIQDMVALSNTEIRYFVYLSQCHFNDVSFFQSTFTKGLSIDGTTFDGKVYFGYATVMKVLSAVGAHFNNQDKDGGANFNTIKVTGPVFLDGATFAGEVNFAFAVIDGPVSIKDARFNSETQEVTFDSMKSGPTFFDGSTFAGPVTFVYAVIDGSFGIKNAKFNSEKREVSFNTMKIDRGFFAEGAIFKGPVNLINLRIADNFEGKTAHFDSPKGVVNFQMMSSGHHVFLSKAEFSGPVDFSSANVSGNLELDEAVFKNANSRPLFRDMRVNSISMYDARFSSPADLSNLTYQNIYPLSDLLAQIKKSDSDYSAYTQLESCLQRNGLASEADEVFMERKRYERRQGMRWYDYPKSYLSEALQGFGRKPHRVLYYDFGVILIGTIIFRRRKMVQKAAEANDNQGTATGSKRPPPYNSFLYSLTLFAPTIDTQYTNNWEPGPADPKTKACAQAQKILGYILVPLTIGIWTGIFK